jgi:DNA polymerase
VTDARSLFGAYVRQRLEAGESSWILGETVALPEAQGARPDAPAPAPVGTGGGAPKRAEAGTAPRRPSAEPKWRKGLPPIPGPGVSIPQPTSDLFVGDPLSALSMEELAGRVRECTACGLCEGRTHAVPGEGPLDAKLVVVGEGPGAREDELGRPFVGRAGELLTDILAAIEIPREQVFICNVVKCRPPQNRTPAQPEIEACLPYLHRQLAIVRPAVILAMGSTAAQTLLQTRQSLGAMRNKVHDFRGTPLIVTYPPAALLRNPNWKKPTWDDVRIARQLVDRD